MRIPQTGGNARPDSAGVCLDEAVEALAAKFGRFEAGRKGAVRVEATSNKAFSWYPPPNTGMRIAAAAFEVRNVQV